MTSLTRLAIALGAGALATAFLSGCGTNHSTAHDAQAYTCSQFDSPATDQTDAEHDARNVQVLRELLKIHGYAASRGNITTIENEYETRTAVDGPCKNAKLDDAIDWSSGELSTGDVGSSKASGWPTDTSKSDFCGGWKAISDASAGGSDEAAFTSLQDAVKKLRDIGTPSDIPSDARAGYQVVVDAVINAKWDDVKNTTGADSFPGVSDTDKAKAITFGQWVVTECPA